MDSCELLKYSYEDWETILVTVCKQSVTLKEKLPKLVKARDLEKAFNLSVTPALIDDLSACNTGEVVTRIVNYIENHAVLGQFVSRDKLIKYWSRANWQDVRCSNFHREVIQDFLVEAIDVRHLSQEHIDSVLIIMRDNVQYMQILSGFMYDGTLVDVMPALTVGLNALASKDVHVSCLDAVFQSLAPEELWSASYGFKRLIVRYYSRIEDFSKLVEFNSEKYLGGLERCLNLRKSLDDVGDYILCSDEDYAVLCLGKESKLSYEDKSTLYDGVDRVCSRARYPNTLEVISHIFDKSPVEVLAYETLETIMRLSVNSWDSALSEFMDGMSAVAVGVVRNLEPRDFPNWSMQHLVCVEDYLSDLDSGVLTRMFRINLDTFKLYMRYYPTNLIQLLRHTDVVWECTEESVLSEYISENLVGYIVEPRYLGLTKFIPMYATVEDRTLLFKFFDLCEEHLDEEFYDELQSLLGWYELINVIEIYTSLDLETLELVKLLKTTLDNARTLE